MPYAMIEGTNIFYVVQGDGTPIIFVHPPLLSSISFTHQADLLSKSFKTVSFDIRGHGKSEPSKTAITYPLLANDIHQLMNHLEIDKAFLCGYSTGGSVVLEFLLTYPERAIGGILIGGLSEVHDLRLRCMISLGVMLAKLGAMRTLAFGLSWSNSDTLQLFQDEYDNAKKGNPKNVEQYYRYSLKYNCTDTLFKINHPMLLVYGEKEKGFHSYGRLLHNHLPHSEITFIRGVKHQIPTKRFTELNHLIIQFVRHNMS